MEDENTKKILEAISEIKSDVGELKSDMSMLDHKISKNSLELENLARATQEGFSESEDRDNELEVQIDRKRIDVINQNGRL